MDPVDPDPQFYFDPNQNSKLTKIIFKFKKKIILLFEH